jgi:DNA adenine methylase
MASRYYTPLRYPGGKSKLSGLTEQVIRFNGLQGGNYIEPYAGGAAVALELLSKNIVSHIHINDLNMGVHSFWDSVLNRTEDLMGRIYDCTLDMPTWYAQREVMNNPSEHSSLEIGFAFFYLNRTNRSGIINAGVIGGYNQTGNYKIDARFNKDDLIDRITQIAKLKEQISLYNMDAELFLEKIDSEAHHCAFAYIDPPYFSKGKRLYDNFYETDDHSRISLLVKRLNLPWMLSYDDHIAIRSLYSHFRMSEISLVYSAALKMRGQEILYFSEDLALPAEIDVA